MGIREQGYRHWEGHYTGHAFRWWTITKAALRSTVYTKGRLFLNLILVGVAWVFALFLSVFYFFFPEAAARGGDPDAQLRQNLADMLIAWQWMWAVVFSAIIGSRLVSADLRSEALYIYLSKPMRRVDYFIGKFLACLLWLIPVTILPALWVFIAANGASNEVLKIDEPGEIFWETLGVYGLLITMCAACAVAISSFTKRWALALIGWISIPFLTLIIGEIATEATREPNWSYVSPIMNIFTVADHLWEQETSPVFDPAWGGAFWALIGLTTVALGAFLARIWFLEVSE